MVIAGLFLAGDVVAVAL